MKEIIQRLQAPTPLFFRKIRNVGLVLTAVAGAIATAPVALPASLITAAGYLALAGAIASAVSQTAVKTGRQK
jgi:small-conductance mechanosensitive channel